MKIVQINSTCGIGSTGKICVEISRLLSQNDIENYILFSGKSNGFSAGIPYSSPFYVKLQALKSRFLGNYGFNSQKATRRLINKLEEIAPDIVHIHNIHGHDCDLTGLLNYLKGTKAIIVWTFHDCWTFTGYCTYYDIVECNKWKEGGCTRCPQKKKTSWFFDRSSTMFRRKKKLFCDIDMTIVTPSKWLADQIGQSFLNNYSVRVINNGIDLSVFTPRESDFRSKHNLENKFVVLGVAFDWGKRKGLDVFVELSKMLDDRYQIVLVGTNDKIDKLLPSNIISIHRTHNQAELAEIYTAADVFANPTREENFPTVNLESLACGTPVVTFKTGGSPEMLDNTCGRVVERNDIDSLFKAIVDVCEKKAIKSEDCVYKASKYDSRNKYLEYIYLYENLTKEV